MSKGLNRRVQFFPTACGYAALLAMAMSMGSFGSAVAQEELEAGSLCDNVRDATAASDFPQPEVRKSAQGLLSTRLEACVGKNKLVDQGTGETREVSTTTYDGVFPGPTLVVKPGDRLSIGLRNNLPANPKDARKGLYPHDPNSTNFHSHGLTVSPLGISDNIFRVMEPKTTNRVRIDIPDDHPSGTYWYHPHKHGSATYQFLGGMAGFLIVKGGPGTLDAVPEVAAAKDVVMGFQVIRTTTEGEQAFVHQHAEQFGTFPFGTEDKKQQGVWSTYGLDGAPGRSFFYYTTNGVTNPTLRMRPGEVQRWRLLNASDSDNLVLTMKGHGFNIIAMDGITVANMYRLETGEPLVMGPGQRMDVLVKAGEPGTYRLHTQDPANPDFAASVSPSGIAPAARNSRHSFDFPTPCAKPGTAVDSGLVDLETAGVDHDGADHGSDDHGAAAAPNNPCKNMVTYPITLATVIVEGNPLPMDLPAGPLPVPASLPSVATMLGTTPNEFRNVAFELCGNKEGTIMERARNRLPSCGWYYAKYADSWGGKPFNNLQMMRDADDEGKPNPVDDRFMPLVDFKKDAIFNPAQPLFKGMVAGNYEEWTIVNRTYSDHPFHIHQNPFLVTEINGIALRRPEWHDTIIVPGTKKQPTNFLPPPHQPNINKIKYGSITFRIYFNPITVGCFVMHCHILNHEDMSMMQRLDIVPARDQSSGCVLPPPTMDH